MSEVEKLQLAGVSKKSRMAALLLAFFLGGFGLHRFYVGKMGSGYAQLQFLNIFSPVSLTLIIY